MSDTASGRSPTPEGNVLIRHAGAWDDNRHAAAFVAAVVRAMVKNIRASKTSSKTNV